MEANWTRTSYKKDPVSGLYLPGDLLEPQRIGLLHNNTSFAGWSELANLTKGAADTVAGVASLIWVEDGATAVHRTYYNVISLTNGTVYSLSFLVEPITRTVIGASWNNGATPTWAHWILSGNGSVGYSNGFDSLGIEYRGNDVYWCWGVWTHAETAGRTPSFCARNENADVNPGTQTYAGNSSNAFNLTLPDVEVGRYPSSPIATGSGDTTRTADSQLIYDLGAEMSGGQEGTILFPVCFPEHTPAVDQNFLALVDASDAANHYAAMRIHTDKKMRGWVKAGGSIGATSSVADLSDGKVHWAGLAWKPDCSVLFFDDEVVGEFGGVGAPTGLDSLRVYPVGQWTGGVAMWPKFMNRMPRPPQPQLLAA
jgi:hypothetical protein